MEKKNAFQKPLTFALLALAATALWGTAFPAIKLGYAWFSVSGTGSAMLFAGLRFMLAGLIVLLVFTVKNKKPPALTAKEFPPVLLLAFVQVVGDYFFYYIGLAHTQGSVASIVNSFDAFCVVALGAVFFKNDRLTVRKTLGCLIGIAGTVIINLRGAVFDFHMTGEGFLLISAVFSTFGILLSKKTAASIDPILLTGYYLLIGGVLLSGIGLFSGGRISFASAKGDLCLVYLALVAATAFMLWTTLLKYNPASRVGVFKLMTPIFGNVFSAVFLRENIFTPTHLLAVFLVSAGIGIVNYEPNSRQEHR